MDPNAGRAPVPTPPIYHIDLEEEEGTKRKDSSADLIGKPLHHNQRYFKDGESSTLGDLFFRRSYMWILCILIPIAYLCIFFGVIPIGNRQHISDSGRNIFGYWVFICVVNPINSVIISFMSVAVFLACMGVHRAFRVHPSILIATFIVQLCVWLLIIPFTGAFPLLGAISLALTYITSFVAVYVYERWRMDHQTEFNGSDKEITRLSFGSYFWKFIKVLFAFFVFFLVLVVYIYGYSILGSGAGQKLLPFAMSIGIFIFRKIMLSLTESFPLDIAMFISGFWVENIYDMFQVMAYRSVKDPVNYFTIWLTNVLSIVANIVFLTDVWFEFRIRIKMFLKLLFRCKPTLQLDVHADNEELEDDRGQSNNKPGYHRRQVWFITLKIFSKMISALFYIAIATLLRYGINKDLFPFVNDTLDGYRNSIIYSFANFGFLVLAAIFVFMYIRFVRPNLVKYMLSVGSSIVKNRTFIGIVIALVAHNGILAISMVMYFSKIWYFIHDDGTD